MTRKMLMRKFYKLFFYRWLWYIIQTNQKFPGFIRKKMTRIRLFTLKYSLWTLWSFIVNVLSDIIMYKMALIFKYLWAKLSGRTGSMGIQYLGSNISLEWWPSYRSLRRLGKFPDFRRFWDADYKNVS